MLGVVIARRARWERLSAFFASRGDVELGSLVGAGSVVGVGIGGGSGVVEVAGETIFVKRIALTERELVRGTGNVFGLPLVCQYGIGSPGFNGWRELAANEIVSGGVLAGETESFPVLYHWRVLPGRPVIALDGVVEAFGGHPAVRDRVEALAAATHSLVLFLEYVPHPLDGWLRDDPVGKAGNVERQLARIVTFLRGRGLLHMDGHFGNMRTDGERIYLTDFGLAISPRFDLSGAERDFVRRHADHDAGYAAMRLVNWLVTSVCGAGSEPAARNEYVRRCAAGRVPDDVPSAVAEILARHAPAAARMNGFYWKLFGGDLNAEYPVTWRG